ncbi:hypothetical protein M3Y95_00764600 [Aphelenchoides besseyi]|nr:hypothetical protein M3Y95_00764600 [Aphelenchoides besseyi]
MTSRPFNPTSSKSLNQLHSDNDIESSKEKPHRLHDRRSRSLSRTPIKTRSQHVNWHLRIAQFVEVHGMKLAILVTYLNLFYDL